MTTGHIDARRQTKITKLTHIRKVFSRDPESSQWKTNIFVSVVVSESDIKLSSHSLDYKADKDHCASYSLKVAEEARPQRENWEEQEQNFLAMETFQDILCLPKEQQPETQCPPLPKPIAKEQSIEKASQNKEPREQDFSDHILSLLEIQQQPETETQQSSLPKLVPKGLLTKSYNNYQVLAEKLANEGLLLSYQVKNPEIVKKIEEHYSTAAESLEGIGELMEFWAKHGRREHGPSELGLLVLNEIAFTNSGRHMKEVYNIASTPALDEARVEITDRVDNLLRLQKKQQMAEGFDCDSH